MPLVSIKARHVAVANKATTWLVRFDPLLPVKAGEETPPKVTRSISSLCTDPKENSRWREAAPFRLQWVAVSVRHTEMVSAVQRQHTENLNAMQLRHFASSSDLSSC
jgi:hypothetical protein